MAEKEQVWELSSLQSQDKKIIKRFDTCVILHLYYPEMWDEIRAYLSNLGQQFDLFVTIPHEVDFPVDMIRTSFPNANIYSCENRGRDIASFLSVFSGISKLGYNYICKIHTKKSVHINNGTEWQRDMMVKLLGSPKTVTRIKKAFDEHSDWGLIGPKGHVVPHTCYWTQNAQNVLKLAHSIGIPTNDIEFSFVAGSMFWFRPQALNLLLNPDLLTQNFEAEQGQKDGTLAHAFERLFGMVSNHGGYKIAETDSQEIKPADVPFQFYLLIDAFEKQEQTLHALSAQSLMQEDTIRSLTGQLLKQDQVVQSLTHQLTEITNSMAWSIALRIRQTGSLLLPSGSKREQIARQSIQYLRIWRSEGIHSLLVGSIARFSQIISLSLYRSINYLSGNKLSNQQFKDENRVRTNSSRPYKSIPRLAQVLQEKARRIDESGMFDHEWYLQDNPDVESLWINPVEHYLVEGKRNERNPTPLFNTSIYAKSLNGDIPWEDAFLHFIDSGRLFAPGAYRNAEVLMVAQQNYRRETNMQCLSDQRSTPRRYAVYLQCGAGSVHETWLANQTRNWDLLVNHYDQTYVGKIACDIEFSQSGKQPGTKFTAFHTLLERWPQLLQTYDYILLLDDDILIEMQQIDRLFLIAQEKRLKLAQASLSPESYCAHPIFKTIGKRGIRYVNAVEIMMPILSRQAIYEGAHLFGQTISGWGLDVVLGKLCSTNGGAAVIDDVIAHHTKPINVGNGAFYEMLHRAYIYPEIELTHFQRIYKVGRSFYRVRR